MRAVLSCISWFFYISVIEMRVFVCKDLSVFFFFVFFVVFSFFFVFFLFSFFFFFFHNSCAMYSLFFK